MVFRKPADLNSSSEMDFDKKPDMSVESMSLDELPQPLSPTKSQTDENSKAQRRLKRWTRQYEWYQNEYLNGMYGPPPMNTPSSGSAEHIDFFTDPDLLAQVPSQDRQPDIESADKNEFNIEQKIDYEMNQSAGDDITATPNENQPKPVHAQTKMSNDRKRPAPKSKKKKKKQEKKSPSVALGGVPAVVSPSKDSPEYKKTPPSSPTSGDFTSGPDRNKRRDRDQFKPEDSAWTSPPSSPIASRLGQRPRSTPALRDTNLHQ